MLAVDDIRTAFDTVNIADVVEDHRRHIQDTKLVALVERVLRGGDDVERAVGIHQGDPYSPTALNVRLHFVHDLPLSRDDRHPFVFRYADNLVYLCTTVFEGHQALDLSRRLLTRAGLTLKSDDGPPVDLRCGGRAELLGFTLRYENEKPCLGLGKSAWKGLKQNLAEAHESENPSEAARATVQGWLNDRAPAFEGQTETVVRRTLTLAAHQGFRELSSPGELRRLVEQSLKRWDDLLMGAYRQRGNVQEGLAAHVGPPAPTVFPRRARASARLRQGHPGKDPRVPGSNGRDPTCRRVAEDRQPATGVVQ